MKDSVKHFFKTNPNANVVYETSNGFLFPQLHDATAHGNTLKAKNVTTYTREQAEAASENTNQKQASADEDKPSLDWRLADLKEYAQEKGIALAAEDKTKEAVLAKINAASTTPSTTTTNA